MKSKLGVTEKVIEGYAASRIAKFVDAMRVGWNAYNFIFYIASIAAIFGILTGWVGLFFIVITILFFYYAGRFKEKVDLVQKRNKLKSKKG